MSNNQNSGDEPAIHSQRIAEKIFAEWLAEKTAKQIADHLNIPIKEVMKSLKERQKSEIHKGSLKR